MRRWWYAGASAALVLLAGCASAPVRPAPYFYSGKSYGSEAQFNPLSEILNEAYDFLQLHGRDRRVFAFDYRGSFDALGRSLAHPSRALASEGWWNVWREEVLPIGKSGAWLPNYQLHLLGSGMVYARMEEWYEQHGVSLARPLAIATLATAHILNEAVEGGPAKGYSGASIVDLALFDAGGIVLFSADRVRRFASRFEFTNWPGQPSFAPARHSADWTIENASQWYVFKVPLDSARRWSIFANWGIGNLYGVTRLWESGRALSVGIGAQSGALIQRDLNPDHDVVSVHGQAGVFYDRDNSLLVSVVQSASKFRGLEINIYPGALWNERPRLGMWVHLPRSGPMAMGVSLPWTPGMAWVR